jgi:nucleotide-binding universal stress UspA family protein
VGPIVCATHGGEASRRTRERAIQLAKESGAELIFLYVVDPSFAQDTDEAMQAAIADELNRLGRSLLGIARAQAEKEGVRTRAVVKLGPIQETIKDYLRQVNASRLVIGAAKPSERAPTFDAAKMEGFAGVVQNELNIEVVTVKEEEE